MDADNQPPLLVSIPKAAQLVGIGRSSIYRAINEGGLPSTKIGKRRLVPVEALRQWLNSLTS